MPSPRVEIVYCTQCRWLLRAAWVAQELLTTFVDELGEVALVPGRGGIFEVRLDGTVLFSRAAVGRFPEAAELKQLVRDRIAPDRDLGHSDRHKPPSKPPGASLADAAIHASTAVFEAAESHQFEEAERRRWLPPDAVVSALDLKPGWVVADIGAGAGYFAIPMAERVAPSGRVIAVDLEPRVADELRRRLGAPAAPQNVDVIIGDAVRTGLPDACADAALLSDIWYALTDREAVIDEMHRVLRPGGRLAVIDWRPDVDRPPGPPMEDRLTAADIARALSDKGWTVLKSEPVGVFNYLVVAHR